MLTGADVTNSGLQGVRERESCDSLQWPGKFRCQQQRAGKKRLLSTTDWRKRGEIKPSLPGRKNIMV